LKKTFSSIYFNKYVSLIISISDHYCDNVLNIVLWNIYIHKLNLLGIISVTLSLVYINLTYNNLLHKLFIPCVIVIKPVSKILNPANIQDTNEVLSVLFSFQCLIRHPHQPFEQMIKHAFGHGTHWVRDLQLYKIYYFQFFLIIHPFVVCHINDW
jgi:hypothetical protein